MSERFRFIALYGVLGWGITCFILSTATRYFRHGVSVSPATFLIDLPIWLFGGLFFGYSMWTIRVSKKSK
jgi:hypothetical protein